jgi:hypothetical protein
MLKSIFFNLSRLLLAFLLIGSFILENLSLPLYKDCGLAIAQGQNLIFYDPLSSLTSITANSGTSSGLTFTGDTTRIGALVGVSDTLNYPAINKIDPMKGTIEFWLQPQWNGNNVGLKTFFTANFNANHSLNVSLFTVGGMAQYVRIELYNTAIPNFPYLRVYTENIPIVSWKAKQWHKIQVFWDFTLPEGQQYLTGKVDGCYFNYNGSSDKIPYIPEQSLDSNAKIYLGQHPSAPAKYNADAILSEVKIYNESLLPVIPYPLNTYNPWKPDTDLPIRNLFANDGFCSPFENNKLMPTDAPKLSDTISPGEKVLFFQKPAFVAVYEGTVPDAAEIKGAMNYVAAPGQFVDLFFNVYARDNLTNVKLTYSDFKGAKSKGTTTITIPKTNLDLRVVRNWFQFGGELPRYVPELLVHNDQIPLETVTPPNPLYLVKNGANSSWFIPSMPILDYVQTKMTQYTSKQFVMIVKVPDNTPPGIYTGVVALQADGISQKQLTLSLEVLPFSLRDTGKKYMINWGSATPDIISQLMPRDWETEIRREFQDLKDHGINGIVFYGGIDASNPVKNQKLLSLAVQYGFEDAIVYIYSTQANQAERITWDVKELIEDYGFRAYFWGVDEVSVNYLASEHIVKSQWIHSLGAKVATSTGKDFSDALDDPIDALYTSSPPGTYEPLDWPLLSVTGGPTCAFFDGLMKGTMIKPPGKTWSYYWQCNQEDPRVSRRFAGYHLMVTDLDGISPHMYMASAMDCYNEFNRGFSQSYTVYPTREGVIPTIQWEALRAGINDGKYVATWQYYKNLAAKVNPTMAKDSETVVNGILAHYKFSDPDPNRVPIDIAQFETDLQTIIQEIKKLMPYAR